MRIILVSVFVCLFSLHALAQAPDKMSYQAVVRDNANALVVDKVVSMRISILRGSASGTAVYVETQSPRSNTNGLVTLEIGAGTVVSGSFAGLNWSTGPYFIQTEIDPSGGSNYTILGVSQLVSVPYALYAKTSGSSTPGPAGPAGVTGPQGPIGPAGAAGANGEAGATGPQGSKGDTGATGPQGAIGLTGPAGAVGPQGPKGDTGATGPQGPIGLTGPAGANGTNGTNGAPGVGGVTTAGTNITLTGSGTVASPYVVSANIPAAAAGTLTGTSLNATVTGSSLTSVGTLTNLTVTNPIVGSVTGSSGSTTGNAATATTLATPRNINGVAFDGSADITVAAAAGTLSGTTLNANVTGSSLTSVGTLTNLTVTNPIVGSVTGSSGSTTGNAASATKLVTPRNINDVAFDGSADITVSAAAGSLSGTTLNATVTGSSLTSVGTIASLSTGSITNSGKVIVGASSAASASAVLEASSTSQGFLPPRMTRDQRIAIVNPAAGLIVWCTNCGTAGELQVNNGTSWTNLIGGPASFAVPDAPTSPVATAGNAQASVAFIPPASNGGSTITGYTVTSSPGGFTATGASSPLVVTGLATNIAYTFTVVATNAAGNSVASVASVSVTPFGVITNPTTGKTWMDRNLGATQVAASSIDAAAYGDLYQWGRGADGHQLRNSPTTTTLSSSDQPGNGNFILVPNDPNDWRSPQNNNLWQGVNGVNNPCPSGYRLPTSTELDAERSSWGNNYFNAAGAFNSLKLPLAGYRKYSDGLLDNVGTVGYYWNSTINGTNSRSLFFNSTLLSVSSFERRAEGNSVRCIMNYN